MTFFGNFLGQKVTDIQNGLSQVVVYFDPDTASQAQIQTIADAVSSLNGRLAQLQVNVEQAQKKVDADNSAIHQRMDAAGILSGQGKDDKAASLLDEIEKTLKPALDGDSRDLADIQSSIAQIESRKGELEAKLHSAKSRIDNARRDMERAKIDQARAQDTEDQAKRDAGIIKTVSGLDVASDAMEKAAQAARVKAEQARMNAKSFAGAAPVSKSLDSDIQAALAQASGTASAPTQSVADRLAAMKAAMSSGKAA